MPLSRHLAQGRLLYFTQHPDAISVSENDYFRWLAFGNVVQSLIRKSKPQQLTLPHQWALMMPLLNMTPTTVVELGLGAGNHLLFSQGLNKNIDHSVIEANPLIIELATNYFGLNPYQEKLIHQDAQSWLYQQTQLSADWYIFDIYQKAKFRDNSYNLLLAEMMARLPTGSILSINFPEATKKELNFWLTQAAKKLSHSIHFYTVPQFQNQILHLIPIQPQSGITIEPALPPRLQKYWRKYQLQFGAKTG